MSAEYREFSDRLAQYFAAMGEMIEEQVLGGMIAAGDTFCSIQFENTQTSTRSMTPDCDAG
jgi:hypothetical protein